MIVKRLIVALIMVATVMIVIGAILATRMPWYVAMPFGFTLGFIGGEIAERIYYD